MQLAVYFIKGRGKRVAGLRQSYCDEIAKVYLFQAVRLGYPYSSVFCP